MANYSIDKKLDTLINAVEKLIANPVAPVAVVAPVAPVLPVAPLVPNNPEDHNLILGLVGKLDTVNVKVDALKDDISDLKKDKDIFVNQTQHLDVVKNVADHETRIRKMEDVVSDVATIKRLVYGCVGLILTTVIVAIIYLVIKQ